MSAVRGFGAATAAVARRDATLYFSYRMAFFTQLVSMIASVTPFYYLSRVVTVQSFGSPDRYFEYVVVGLVILQTVTGTIGQAPSTVRQELVAGTLERLVLSPFGAIAAVVSMIAFPFLRAAIFSVLMIVFAMVTFGLQLEWPSMLLAIPGALLGALAFTPFALLFTLRSSRSSRHRPRLDGDLARRRLVFPRRAAALVDPMDLGGSAVHARGGTAASSRGGDRARRISVA